MVTGRKNFLITMDHDVNVTRLKTGKTHTEVVVLTDPDIFSDVEFRYSTMLNIYVSVRLMILKMIIKALNRPKRALA